MAERHYRRRSRSVFWTAFVLMAALSTLWPLASPIFSVPDENVHATKAIAQVHGQVIGYHVPGIKHTVVGLPHGYSYAPHILCFAYHANQPANCRVELGDEGGTDWFNTWVGAYNPYYYAVGWWSLILDGSTGDYAPGEPAASASSYRLFGYPSLLRRCHYVLACGRATTRDSG